MKRKTIIFNHKPLRLSTSIVTDESVPGRQTYDATTGGHIPDYTLTPLVLQPLVGMIDADGMLPSGGANGRLTNIRWEMLQANGTWKTVGTTDTDFSLVTEATNADHDGTAGRIYVRRNADPGHPISLRFSADFVDPRDGRTSRVAMNYSVRCDNATAPAATVSLDCSQCVYNPLSDPDLQTVTATVNSAEGTPAIGDYLLVWSLMDDSGKWTDVASANATMIEAKVSADGQSITIDRSLMGHVCRIRCQLRHSYTSKPGDADFNAMAPLSDHTPHAVCVICRKLPVTDCDLTVATNIPADSTKILAEISIRTQKGAVLKNTQGILQPVLRTARRTASGAGTMETVSTELATMLDTSKIDATHGMAVDYDVIDPGPLAILTDNDGTILTDDAGNILLFH